MYESGGSSKKYPSSIDRGLHRPRRNAELGRLGSVDQPVFYRSVGLVHGDGDDGAVVIPERGAGELAAAGDAADALRVRPDKLRKVSDVVGGSVNQLAGRGIGVHGGKAEIPGVVRPPLFVEQDIPVDPAHGSVVEIVNHRSRVLLGIRPVLKTSGVELLNASFGEEQLLVGIGFVKGPDIFEHRFASGPGFIPVEPGAPGVFGGLRVLVDNLRALVQQVSVVVTDNNLRRP